MEMELPSATVELPTGQMVGEKVTTSKRQLKQLKELFEDKDAFDQMDPDQTVYEVVMHSEAKEGERGGLLFGTSYLYPGKVGKEYFMTKGHFHEKRDRGEYYWGLKGEGALVLMKESGETKVEKVFPGSLHYIEGHTAHRLVNTGSTLLAVGACWPSDAGHDYDTIREKGFSIQIVEKDNKTVILKKKQGRIV